MKYRIDTALPDSAPYESKFTDLSKPGNLKWFVSHLKWCVANNRIVYLTPTIESN